MSDRFRPAESRQQSWSWHSQRPTSQGRTVALKRQRRISAYPHLLAGGCAHARPRADLPIGAGADMKQIRDCCSGNRQPWGGGSCCDKVTWRVYLRSSVSVRGCGTEGGMSSALTAEHSRPHPAALPRLPVLRNDESACPGPTVADAGGRPLPHIPAGHPPPHLGPVSLAVTSLQARRLSLRSPRTLKIFRRRSGTGVRTS